MIAGLKIFTRVSRAFVEAAERNLLDVNQMVARVEQEDAKQFLVQRPHFGPDQFIHEFGRVDFRFGKCLARQPAAKSECRCELHGFGGADAFGRRQFVHAATREAAEGLVGYEEFAGEINGVVAFHSGAKQDRDQLAVAQRARSVCREFFTGPILFRQFVNRQGRHAKGGASCYANWSSMFSTDSLTLRRPSLNLFGLST